MCQEDELLTWLDVPNYEAFFREITKGRTQFSYDEIRELTNAIVEYTNRDVRCKDKSHPETRLVYLIASNGQRMYYRECVICHEREGNWIPHAKLDINDVDQAVERTSLDYNYIYQRKVAVRSTLIAMLESNRTNDWWAWYNEYLQSPKWKAIREKVLKRDNYLCQGCLENRANQVHHKNYETVGDEVLFDLISFLCWSFTWRKWSIITSSG